MADPIDRQELRKAMYHEAFETDSDEQMWDSGCWIRYKMFERILDSLPPAQPEPRWIPCSERLPEALEEVLVTSKHGYVYTSRIVHGEFEYGGEVVAWMPLPKPYKEDSDG